jgi:hypothetical protein
MDKDGNPVGSGNAIIGAHLTRLGLPIEAVICATMVESKEMMQLTPQVKGRPAMLLTGEFKW